jgi:uncharacterized surface protein with fasciclin (FAS1) repeats
MFGTSSNDSNRLNLLRILNSSVVVTQNNELANFGNPNDSGTVATYGGEVIKYKYNTALGKTQLITAGSIDGNKTILVDSIKTSKNGRVVYLNDLLYFTYTSIGKHIEALGTPVNSEFNYFWQYLKNSSVYDAATGTITGTSAGSFYTVFIPNNNAIKQDITDGLLPGTAASPNFNPASTADKVLVSKFIQYHILNKRTVIPDGKDTEGFETLLKTDQGDPYLVRIEYAGSKMQIVDLGGRRAELVLAQSNQLSNRTVIHLIDKYLKYN